MNEKLRKIINHYGIDKQLKYFQSEVFELNEAIIKRRNTGVLEDVCIGICNTISPIINPQYKDYRLEAIKDELADVMVMLKQFQLYYDISTDDIKKIMKDKVDRQLERIKYEPKHGKEE